MRKLLLSALIFGICYASEAQIDPLYAQYLSNPLLINPAYSGLNNNLNIGVTYRKQWAGFDGSPATYNVNGHTSLLDNRMGVGLIVVRDNIGINSNTEVTQKLNEPSKEKEIQRSTGCRSCLDEERKYYS